jgi:hypothetical protein
VSKKYTFWNSKIFFKKGVKFSENGPIKVIEGQRNPKKRKKIKVPKSVLFGTFLISKKDKQKRAPHTNLGCSFFKD